MFRKTAAAAAWIVLCFIAYASISRITSRPTLHVSVSLEHIAAFAFVGLLFYLGYPNRITFVLVIVIGSATLLELMQLVTIDRHARLADLIEKICGGGLGLAAGRTLACYEGAFREWAQVRATGGRWRHLAPYTLKRNSLSRAPDIQTPSHQPERRG
jgi:hypothetical protein